MIERLVIDNYALIEHLDLQFASGLTIITGETGAGKSIMLDALGLLMGERADSKAIADKTKKTLVETTFSDFPDGLKEVFDKFSLEWEHDNLIVRREISPSGRSRAFVNDTPVTLQVLTEVTSRLIDIHTQHNNLTLQDPATHLKLIDDFSVSKVILNEYKNLFNRYAHLRTRIRKLKENLENQREKREFIAFRLEQLEKIKPRDGELEKIEKEFDMLSDADQIRNDLGEACLLLNESDPSILSSLSSLESLLGDMELSIIGDEEDEDIQERLSAVRVELKDIYETLSNYLERVESNPSRLAKVSARMNLLYDAIKRFKVKDEKELVQLYEQLQEEFESLETGDDDLKELEKESRTLAQEIKSLADKISVERKESAKVFCEKLRNIALPLGLSNLKLDMEFTLTKLTSEGQDKAVLMCSFNKNQPLQPIGLVASGGEVSRLMLSLKSLMSDKRKLPTIIFDEVDTGVSGEIADKMGEMMKFMAENMQVIVITHLPQVAAKGNSHFKVYKDDDETKTVSNVRKLDKEERIREIASMLSGSTVNKEALANAKVLLGY